MYIINTAHAATAEFANYTNVGGFKSLLAALFQGMLALAIPVMALVLIYIGLTFIMAQGNKDKITQATRYLTYALLGIALVLGGYMISSVLYNTVIVKIMGWN